jgi:hypothetical protein
MNLKRDPECLWAREELSASLDGELERSSARRLKAHLERCPECRRVERELRECGERVVRLEWPVLDSGQAFLRRIKARRALQRRVSWSLFGAGAAAALLVAALLGPVFQSRSTLDEKILGDLALWMELETRLSELDQDSLRAILEPQPPASAGESPGGFDPLDLLLVEELDGERL